LLTRNILTMKKFLAIFSLLLLLAILFVQCKSRECTYKPKAAKSSNIWQQRWFVSDSWMACCLFAMRAGAYPVGATKWEQSLFYFPVVFNCIILWWRNPFCFFPCYWWFPSCLPNAKAAIVPVNPSQRNPQAPGTRSVDFTFLFLLR